MTAFTFTEDNSGPYASVTISWENGQYGDALNDNAWQEDFYRYHDVFHFGLYALQGYSAVVRHFMDKVSSAREQKLEECLAIIAFNDAQHRGFYRQQTPSRHLYKFWRDETMDTLLAPPAYKQWAQNLKQIYGIWQQLADHRGGIVDVDPDKKILSYRLRI